MIESFENREAIFTFERYSDDTFVPTNGSQLYKTKNHRFESH